MAFADVMNNPAFLAFRTRDDIGETLRGVLTRYRVEPLSRWTELLDLSDAVYSGVITVADVPVLVGQAFGLDERTAWRMARDFVSVQLAPVRDVIPGLGEQITAWGSAAPAHVASAKTYEDYADDIALRANLSLAVVHIRRLAYLLKLYVAGERNREQTIAFLTRPLVIGGLELAPEQAAVVLQLVDEEKEKLELQDGADVVAPQRNEQTDVPVPVTPTIVEGSLAVAPSHALANETPVAAKPRDGVIPTKVGIQSSGTDTRLREGQGDEESADSTEIAAHETDAAIARQGAQARDERLVAALSVAVTAAAPTLAKSRIAKKRFEEIARMTLKGVRDPHQSRTVIERDLGITGEPVMELMEALMAGLEAYSAKAVSGEMLDVGAPTIHSPQLTSEADLLDKRFAVVAGEMPKVSVAPVMPEARVSAARTKEEEREEQSTKVDAEKVAAAGEAAKPAPARARLTVGSVPPPPLGESPVVTDIQFTQRLVGPVEELGTMTPADFRRLSSSADEAAHKVEDLLRALEATSYDDRIKGIAAWHASPVNTLYAQMASEALNSGVALAEVASRRRNKGEECLSPAELRAIANINAAIRF